MEHIVEPKKFYFSFGSSSLPNGLYSYVKIEARTQDEAEKIMFASKYQDNWCASYPEEVYKEQIEKHTCVDNFSYLDNAFNSYIKDVLSSTKDTSEVLAIVERLSAEYQISREDMAKAIRERTDKVKASFLHSDNPTSILNEYPDSLVTEDDRASKCRFTNPQRKTYNLEKYGRAYESGDLVRLDCTAYVGRTLVVAKITERGYTLCAPSDYDRYTEEGGFDLLARDESGNLAFFNDDQIADYEIGLYPNDLILVSKKTYKPIEKIGTVYHFDGLTEDNIEHSGMPKSKNIGGEALIIPCTAMHYTDQARLMDSIKRDFRESRDNFVVFDIEKDFYNNVDNGSQDFNISIKSEEKGIAIDGLARNIYSGNSYHVSDELEKLLEEAKLDPSELVTALESGVPSYTAKMYYNCDHKKKEVALTDSNTEYPKRNSRKRKTRKQ